jgi:hypothetical protein
MDTINKEELKEEILGFIDLYFTKLDIYIKQEKRMLANFSNMQIPEIEYLDLFQFILQAVDQLKGVDVSFTKNEKLVRFIHNVSTNIKTLEQFKKDHLPINALFENEYLLKYNSFFKLINKKIDLIQKELQINKGMMNLLETKIDNLKTMDIPPTDIKYKTYNKRLADALYAVDQAKPKLVTLSTQKKEYLAEIKELFFKLAQNHEIKRYTHLTNTINHKIFLLNKVLWTTAKNSEPIVKFFNSLIKEELSLSTYINYYLSSAQSKNLSPEERNIYVECASQLK